MTSLLLVHHGAIGDFVLSLPAIEALHRWSPHARITFLARPDIVEIIHARTYVSKVLDCSSSRWAPLYRSGGTMAGVDTHPLLPVDRIFVFGSSSSQILADNLASVLGKPSRRLDSIPSGAQVEGVGPYQCRQLQAIGIPALPPPPPVVAPSPQALLEARGFVHRNLQPEHRLVLLHPGSGGREKLWSQAGWLALLRRLAGVEDLRLALLQGPADTETVNQLLCRLDHPSILVLKNWPLGSLAGLLSHASLYVGNDSGITHLAAACGTPTIALFGPTDPNIWAPQGPRVSVIRWRGDHPGADSRAESAEALEPPALSRVWQQAGTWLGLRRIPSPVAS
jgi:ADP-heptose:LPS heptosyltransferase